MPLPPMRARSRLVLRAELLPALSVLSTVCLLGLPLGWLWSRLAPAERGVLLGDGGFAPLPGESAHRFDALAVFVLLGLGVGVVTGTAAWLLRRHRGPAVLLAVVAGSALAAWLAMRTGSAFAAARYGEALAAARPGTVVTHPPRLDSMWALIAQPFGAAMAYVAAVAWNRHDDLGRELSRSAGGPGAESPPTPSPSTARTAPPAF